ncbi:hypothetical protein L2E82_16028 [Cichorium intybus]|uniref:Uncharacterized protein n=1 Tax=Cichorium intybus TaxID=13427 RepID=A0ACB9F4U7_CICIN|nr:hypothetical protein L2E82_16028 [Cichorium intybus]
MTGVPVELTEELILRDSTEADEIGCSQRRVTETRNCNVKGDGVDEETRLKLGHWESLVPSSPKPRVSGGKDTRCEEGAQLEPDI